MPLVAELLFRSLAHGLLTQGARIQRYETRWFFSWPVIGSTLLYTGFVFALTSLTQIGGPQDASWHTVLVLFSAAALGLALSMARERSQSLFPAILFHILTAAVAVAVLRFF